MKQNYQDAMTIVRHFGKPDLFITFTCNPNWPEIQHSIFPGQYAKERPDIVVRVFNIKLKELMKDLVNNQVFGKVEAYIYVVEFQKRGLPHAHILLTLREQDKLQSSNCIDGIVSAEIPNPIQMPLLFRLVGEHMIHGPCGPKCMERDVCTKNFPKAFCEQSIYQENGYPKYRRRSPDNGGYTCLKHVNNDVVVEMDNRFVVPYSPALLLKYQCHINVEVCSSFQSVKYVHKYIYKGHDSTNVNIVERVENGLNFAHYDEITTYLSKL